METSHCLSKMMMMMMMIIIIIIIKDTIECVHNYTSKYARKQGYNWTKTMVWICSKIFRNKSRRQPEIATSINIHVPFSLIRIIMSGLLLGIVLPVCTCWFHSIVTLPPWLVSKDLGTCSYHCFCPVVPLFPCIFWSVIVHTIYRVFYYYYYYYYLESTNENW